MLFNPTLPARACAAALLAISLAVPSPASAQGDEDNAPKANDIEASDIEASDIEASDESDPDNSADDLNARQQLRQSFTFERRINGDVVEREQKAIVYDDNDPLRATEAGETPLDALRAAFDREQLTRTEAFEEAKIDFVLADADRDDLMTGEEFSRLSQIRAEREAGTDGAYTDDMAAHAARKFAFMAGAANGLDRAGYIREYLLEFDAIDSDGDGVLSGTELTDFRAASRGLDMPVDADF